MDTILEGLVRWRRQPRRRRRPLTTARTPALLAASRDQDSIGWGPMLMGFHSREWERIQAEHFRNMGSLRSGRRWVVELTALDVGRKSPKKKQGDLPPALEESQVRTEELQRHPRCFHRCLLEYICIMPTTTVVQRVERNSHYYAA